MFTERSLAIYLVLTEHSLVIHLNILVSRQRLVPPAFGQTYS